MGCPSARREREGTMSYHPRASTSSRNAFEDGYKVLHIDTLESSFTVRALAEEEKGCVLESLILQHKHSSRTGKEFSNMQYEHARKQSPMSVCSYERLAPCSPSESNSSSKVSNLGSSSSSSPTSTSSFNETASFAVGELSPIIISGKEVKQGGCSSTRQRLQRSLAPSKIWHDTEMQFKSTLKAFNNTLLEEVVDDGALEQTAGVRSSTSWKHHLGYSKYFNSDREFVDARICHHRDGSSPHAALRHFAEVYPETVSSLSCNKNCLPSSSPTTDTSDAKRNSQSFKTALFPVSMDAAPSKRKGESICSHSADSSSSALAGSKHINPGTKERSFKHKRDYSTAHCSDVDYEMYKEGLVDGYDAGSKPRKGGYVTQDMKGMNQVHGATTKISRCMNSGTQVLSGCNSTPYEADIGVDALSLHLRGAFDKPPRGSSVQQSTHANKRVPQSEIPMALECNFDAKCSEGSASTELSTDKCTSTTMAFRSKKGNLNGFPERGIAARLGANRSSATLHSYYKDPKSSRASVTKTGFHEEDPRQSLVLVSNGKYTEKADAFTPHAPLLPKGPNYKEGSKLNPSLAFSSKSQWDWRSKSLGAKASIKSAVRNLEATFAGSRSLSLPKTRAQVHKEPNFESSTRLLDRVFISPIRARRKQVGILTPIERPIRQSSEVRGNDVLGRRDAKAKTSNLSSQCRVPAGSIIRPLPPIGYNDVEVICKPFLPAPKTTRCLPAPRGVLSTEKPTSSGRKSDGLLSHSSDASSPCAMLSAHLHCTHRDGLPHYTMTIEGSEEMMLAKGCWLESHFSREGCMWQYSFYSGQSSSRGPGSTGWRSWIKKENKTGSDLSGIMKVSSVARYEAMPATKGHEPLKVFEFVLYDGRGAEVSHSQSLRYCSTDKPCLWSRDSSTSLSNPWSEHKPPSNPNHLEMFINKQSGGSTTDSIAGSAKTATMRGAPNLHNSTGGHRPSLSLDAWSDSEVPESAPSPAPCSPSQVELAAMVIQVPSEGDLHAFDADHVIQGSKGWGLKFLNGASESKSSHALSPQEQADKPSRCQRNALNQACLGSSWAYADSKLQPVSSHRNAGGRVLSENQRANVATKMENFRKSSSVADVGRQGSSSVTLLLPTGEHSFPIGGSKGPSSLIERWRSGGSCECGGWDLGCGINVISSICTQDCTISRKSTNRLAPYDQQFNLFSQGSRPELMLGLSLVKQGEFKLSFQRQLPPLKVFAAAVAMLHSNHSPLLQTQALQSPEVRKQAPQLPNSSNELCMMSLSQSLNSSSATLSSSMLSSSHGDMGVTIPDFKGRPPRPSLNYAAVAARMSDTSSKDKVSPLLVHNATFSN